MLSPILLGLLGILHSGGMYVSCQSSNAGSSVKNIIAGESWVISCIDEWNSTNTYHYVPKSSVSLSPACGTGSDYLISADMFGNNYAWIKTTNTVVSVSWACAGPAHSNFDSSFNVAAGNVAAAPSFWALFGMALSGGLFIGSIVYAVNSLLHFIEGGGDKDA